MIITEKDVSLGTLLFRAGCVFVGLKILDDLFSLKNEGTVNYILKHRGRRVYHGICYEDRLDERINEHRSSGKRFDEVVYGEARPRVKAIQIERKRIKRDGTMYNIQHNW